MTNGTGRGGDAHPAATLRGILFIVATGLALGALHNSIGRASRPPRGLEWVKRADPVASLEALQREAITSAPATGAAGATAAGPATPSVPALPTGGAAASAEGLATTPPSAKPLAVAAAPNPAPGTRPAPAAAPRTAAGSPPAPVVDVPRNAVGAATATAATPPGTAPSAPPGDLPVIPDLDRPIKLEMASLKKLYDAGAVLVVDAREAGEYAEGHIAGAVSLPYNDALAEPERLRRLGENGRPIAVYCSGGDCELSMDLARLMIENGRKRVLVYEGGYPEWQAAGHPVAHGAPVGGR